MPQVSHIKYPNLSSMAEANKRYAVVTGANKGIGLEICKQLAFNGIVVVLTSRDEKRGLEAFQKLKDSGLSDYLVFHQLDVADANSVASLAEFVKIHFGKLDILVNNAGISGAIFDVDSLKAWRVNTEVERAKSSKMMTQTYELSEECLKINYYGAKKVTEALLPLLQLSNEPKIVNVSSSLGRLRYIENEWAKELLGDLENLTEERVDEMLNEYLKDFKESSIDTKNWPVFLSAYTISKASMNAYTRILAKKFPTICINCVCPGNVKTDMNYNMGYLSVEEGAENSVRLALLPEGSPSGCFFIEKEKSPFD